MTYPKLSHYELAQKIDHTLLKPTLTLRDLQKTCAEAMEYQFKTVCIPPSWVSTSVKLLEKSPVGTITVVGFPLGYSTTSTKATEAGIAISEGASEVDMVLNLSFLKSGQFTEAEADVRAVVEACGKTPLKVILETAYLTDIEKVEAALLSERAGATFIKTSTGFATGVTQNGATLEDLLLLRKTLKPLTKIKASGGIRDWATAKAFLEAGADRLGTSSGVAILSGLRADGDY